MLSVSAVLRETAKAGVLRDALNEEAVSIEKDEQQNEKRFDASGTGARFARFVLYLFVAHHCGIQYLITLIIVAKLRVCPPFQVANFSLNAFIVLMVYQPVIKLQSVLRSVHFMIAGFNYI